MNFVIYLKRRSVSKIRKTHVELIFYQQVMFTVFNKLLLNALVFQESHNKEVISGKDLL